MKNLFSILTIFSFINCSTYFIPKTNSEIERVHKKVDESKKLQIDSIILKRGIDYNHGVNADLKKYKIFKNKNEIHKIEYEEIGEGYDNWYKKTTLYLKNDVPFLIIEQLKGYARLYLLEGGEKLEPINRFEKIYIYDWAKSLTSRPEGYKICKVCYDELIQNTKSEFKKDTSKKQLMELNK